jgi:hypothetical protein
VEEMLYARKKFNVIQNLDWIAQNVTHTIRPATTILKLPLEAVPTEHVLKRECSDSRRHAFVPKGLERYSVRSLNTKLKKDALDGAEWLSQTFVAELETMGELRVYLFHGEVSHVVQTSWASTNDMKAKEISELWSLEELRYYPSIPVILHLLKSIPTNSQILLTAPSQMPELFVREGGTMVQRAGSRKELFDFVQHTYQSLIDREQLNFNSPSQSSIELMCRMDVGIMRNQCTGQWEYFVNEVERGFLPCLFGSLGPSLISRAADEMMEDIIQLLDMMYESA